VYVHVNFITSCIRIRNTRSNQKFTLVLKEYRPLFDSVCSWNSDLNSEWKVTLHTWLGVSLNWLFLIQIQRGETSLLLFSAFPLPFWCLFRSVYPGSNNGVELARNVIGQVMSLWGRKWVSSNPSSSSPKQVVRGCGLALYLSQFIAFQLIPT
jgi:hypothetical protein